jgi:hypothetical protein
MKQKSGMPLLPPFTLPVSFNNVCLKKWFTALAVIGSAFQNYGSGQPRSRNDFQ